MINISGNHTVNFFETQFQKQVRDNEFALNPFEQLALKYLKGDILDLGAGLGNLCLEAGRLGHNVLAVEASPTAVARINTEAQAEGLAVKAIQEDIESWDIDGSFDTIIAIGLLMFFQRESALRLLQNIQKHVKPGGIAVVNTLIEGTTFMGMFDPDKFYLFTRGELEQCFSGWTILEAVYQSFPAPEGTVKEFSTVIARKADTSGG